MLELNLDACNALRQLIETTDYQDELECRKYLGCIEEYLFKKDTLKKVIYSEYETPLNAGRTDYIISGQISNNPVNPEATKTYIWELKAPQCYLFTKDNENRLTPTPELCSAENQLLNYLHGLKYDLNLVARFKAGHPCNVFVGGIIIGSKDRIVSGNFGQPQKKGELADEAYKIRNEYFYAHTGLELITWSDVLKYFEQKVNEKYVGITKENAIPGFTFFDTKPKAGTISSEQTL